MVERVPACSGQAEQQECDEIEKRQLTPVSGYVEPVHEADDHHEIDNQGKASQAAAVTDDDSQRACYLGEHRKHQSGPGPKTKRIEELDRIRKQRRELRQAVPQE